MVPSFFKRAKAVSNIVINWRRQDAPVEARRIYDIIAARLGRMSVVLADHAATLRYEAGADDILLAALGPRVSS